MSTKLKNQNVVISGTSSGVGREAAVKFLEEGYTVHGIDWKDSTISDPEYHHYKMDVRNFNDLPDIKSVTYLVNNAGIVTPKKDAIPIDLYGYMNLIEKYGWNPDLKSIVNVGSTASFKGYDNLPYCCAQGGRDALTKWCALWLGKDERHVICNSVNIDGVIPSENGDGVGGTTMEPELYADKGAMEAIKNLSVLKRLATVRDIAEWIYFLLVVNKVMTGQILMMDGELTGAWNFIEYKGWND